MVLWIMLQQNLFFGLPPFRLHLMLLDSPNLRWKVWKIPLDCLTKKYNMVLVWTFSPRSHDFTKRDKITGCCGFLIQQVEVRNYKIPLETPTKRHNIVAEWVFFFFFSPQYHDLAACTKGCKTISGYLLFCSQRAAHLDFYCIFEM